MEKTKTYIARLARPRLSLQRRKQSFFSQEKKASFFSPAVRPKLTVGAADDQYEKEADNVAEQVMRMPDNVMLSDSLTPVPASDVQMKCAECEKEEKEEEKKEDEEHEHRERIADLPIQRKCKDCEEEEQDKVSRKKVPSIQRTRDPSFEITGLQADRDSAENANFVFFDIAEPDPTVVNLADSIDTDERSKITTIATQNPQPQLLNLFGFVSEEGGRVDNNALLQRRLDAVTQALVSDGYPASQITPHNLRTASRAHFDYRFWRGVEITESNTSSRVPAGGSATRGVIPCSTSNTNAADAARLEALKILNDVITRLTNYVTNPTDPGIISALDFYFHNHSQTFVRNRLLRRYRRIRSFLNRMMSILHCATPFSQTCNGADAATNPSEIILCDGFFNSSYTTRQQALILIHEAGHGSSTAIGDRAYRSERVFRFLNTSQALANAESLMILVEELTEGSRPTDIVDPDLDTMNNCDSNPTLRDQIRESIAWAQRHNTYAVFGLQDTYGDDENTAFMSPFIIGQFGRADRTALAGILDRYTQMGEIFDGQLTINCLDVTDPQCTTSTLPIWTLAGEVSVCPAHLNQTSMQQRIDHMYAGLAAIMPGVTAAQQFSYPRLARIYKNEFWEERG